MARTGVGEIKYGEGRHAVTLRYIWTEDGLVLVIVGGERPHVGAVAVGSPRRSLRGSGLSSDVSTIARPYHKDDEVAREVARRVSRDLNVYTVVIVGVHVDRATPGDINLLLNNINAAVNTFIKLTQGG